MSLRSRNRKKISSENFFLKIFMLLGRKLRNHRQISSEDLFFRDHQIFATEIKLYSPKWVVKLPWVGKWATV